MLSAELSYEPSAVTARLIDSAGNQIKGMAGTVTAREVNVSPTPEGMIDNAAKAVEALYEAIVAELINKE